MSMEVIQTPIHNIQDLFIVGEQEIFSYDDSYVAPDGLAISPRKTESKSVLKSVPTPQEPVTLVENPKLQANSGRTVPIQKDGSVPQRKSLSNIHLEGWLWKRGFGWLHTWVFRWVVLRGRMLSYYESGSVEPRGFLILTCDTIVEPCAARARDSLGSPVSRFRARHSHSYDHSPRSALSMDSRRKSSHNQSLASLFWPKHQDSSEIEKIRLPHTLSYSSISSSDSFPSPTMQSWLDRRSTSQNSYANPGHDVSTCLGIRIVPTEGADGGKGVWYLEASSIAERNLWLSQLRHSVELAGELPRRRTMRVTMTKESYYYHNYIHNGVFTCQYRLLQTLGQGSQYQIRVAEHLETAKKVAVKIADKAAVSDNRLLSTLFESEIQVTRTMMSKLSHPNVMPVKEIIVDSENVYIVMELMKDSLLDRMARQKRHLVLVNGHLQLSKFAPFDEETARKWLFGILSGLVALHSNGIVHRDITADNILFSQSDEPNIADFGLSFLSSNTAKTFGGVRLGTRSSLPPEVIKYSATSSFQSSLVAASVHRASAILDELHVPSRPYGFSADIWGVGVLAYIMLTGQSPFDGFCTDQAELLLPMGSVCVCGVPWEWCEDDQDGSRSLEPLVYDSPDLDYNLENLETKPQDIRTSNVPEVKNGVFPPTGRNDSPNLGNLQPLFLRQLSSLQLEEFTDESNSESEDSHARYSCHKAHTLEGHFSANSSDSLPSDMNPIPLEKDSRKSKSDFYTSQVDKNSLESGIERYIRLDSNALADQQLLNSESNVQNESQLQNSNLSAVNSRLPASCFKSPECTSKVYSSGLVEQESNSFANSAPQKSPSKKKNACICSRSFFHDAEQSFTEDPSLQRHISEIITEVSKNNYDRIRIPRLFERHWWQWMQVSVEARVFVMSLLNPDPRKRPTADQAMKFAWFNI